MATTNIARETHMVVKEIRGLARLKQLPPSFPVTLFWGAYQAMVAFALFARPDAPELVFIQEAFKIPPSFVVFLYLISSVLITAGYWMFRSLNALVPGTMIMWFMAGSITLQISQSETGPYARIITEWAAVFAVYITIWLAEWVEALQVQLSMRQNPTDGERPHG